MRTLLIAGCGIAACAMAWQGSTGMAALCAIAAALSASA